MLHGVYHEDGPRKDLRFKGALLREDPDNANNYLAQFDTLWLKESHGWWSFPKNNFVNLYPLGVINNERN